MKLSQMQDIGGLRAVVNTLKQVRLLEDDYLNSNFKHTPMKTTDYINNPKSSGYRSVHLIYKYRNKSKPAYDGLLIELQIRTKLQHAWATAVETMGTFLKQALKSSEGEREWLEFFSLSGSAFALLENCAPVPGYENLSKQETYDKVSSRAEQLQIRDKLNAFREAVKMITTEKNTGSYHLVTLDTNKKTIMVESYGRKRLEEANREYAKAERKLKEGVQVVLVSAGPIEALKRAYPNYFLDTTEFIKTLDRIV